MTAWNMAAGTMLGLTAGFVGVRAGIQPTSTVFLVLIGMALAVLLFAALAVATRRDVRYLRRTTEPRTFLRLEATPRDMDFTLGMLHGLGFQDSTEAEYESAAARAR